MTKRIGILTVGGDAPGQNICLKSLVYSSMERAYDVIGIRKGWEGLINYNPDDPDTHSLNTMPLTKVRVRDIDRMPGSFLHSSRIEPDKMPDDPTNHIKRAIAKLGLDALVVLGDHAGLCYAAHLAQAGAPVIGIPKTVHNNIPGSDYALGFSTALGRGVRLINEIRAMAGSREEIAVIEILGHTTGLTTMLISFLAGADHTLVPEVPFDPEKLARLLMNDKQNNPANYAMLVMSEAASIDPENISKYLPELSRLANSRAVAEAVQKSGEGLTTDLLLFEIAQELGSRASGSGAVVTEMLENITRQRMLFQPLSYLLRTGEPDGQDLLGAMNFSTLAIQLIADGKIGRLTAYRQRENYLEIPLDVVLGEPTNVRVSDFYDAENYAVKPGIFWAARV
ncbi:MAG: 6-phosphofructokinase [Chloroflexi bacterium]|nr:6-phosphofructokinase [Chloroflexota bacterium]